MTEQKNDSKVLLRIEVTKDDSTIDNCIKGPMDLVNVIGTLNEEIQDLNETNNRVGKAILSGLIKDCGITKEDFDLVQQVHEVSDAIPNSFKQAVVETVERFQKEVDKSND